MFRNEDEARIALTTGTATPEDLNEIVTSYPQLRTTVAAYPATYPALVDWLANLHDPAVNQALAAPSTVNLQDADIDATTLQKLAATRLELSTAILQHLNCYPELATWMGEQQSAASAKTSGTIKMLGNSVTPPVQRTTASAHSKLTAGDVTKGLGGVAAELGAEAFRQILTWVILGGAIVIGALIGRAFDGGSPGGGTLLGVMAGFITGFLINRKRGYTAFFW